MSCELMASAAETLARGRRNGAVCDLPLDKISSETQAEEIQNAALDALAFEGKGYANVGSSEGRCSTLGLSKPIFSEVLVESGCQLQPGDIITTGSRTNGAGVYSASLSRPPWRQVGISLGRS